MKIQIIGASGTGKSTLAKHIGAQTGIKVIEADRYLWADEFFTVNHPIPKRFEMYKQDIKDGEDYVVAGSVFSWNREGFPDRELLVLLRLDEKIRMARLRNREIERYGETAFYRDSEGLLTNEFIEWCKTYMTEDESAMNSLANHMLQIRLSACQHMILDSNQPIELLSKAIFRQMQKVYK